ncbi:response regulator transcription factor [Xanthobacter sediminis]|uniref:response regulator transcription factor n=1 Tax=Xanthobacter sediminis TaxID=3119926 RepID=UPI003727AFC0
MNSMCKVEAALRHDAEIPVDALADADFGACALPIRMARAARPEPAMATTRIMQPFAVPATLPGDDAAQATSAPWVVHIVDDDAAVRSSLQFTFELDGFDVRTYGGFHELMAADLPHCGCMIVDYNLPEINGLELLRELDRRNVHLPSFLITSNPSQNVRQRANAQGVSIIEKPLLGNQLSEAVRDSFVRALPC